MRRIELDRTRLLAPALARNPGAREPGVENRTGGKDIRALVDPLAAINLGRGVAVVENRLALQFVVIAHVIEASQLEAAVFCDGDRFGADVVQAQRPAMHKRNRLADLDSSRDSFRLTHLL